MHLNPTENRASGPTNPATQMALDAMPHMTEEQRLAFAISLINGAEQTASIPTLRRISTLAATTGQEIEASRMVDALPETSSVDPAFMRLFATFYQNGKTSITKAYKTAVLHVGRNRLTCCVSSEGAVRHALTTYHTN